jgi:hypothetical protein
MTEGDLAFKDHEEVEIEKYFGAIKTIPEDLKKRFRSHLKHFLKYAHSFDSLVESKNIEIN